MLTYDLAARCLRAADPTGQTLWLAQVVVVDDDGTWVWVPAAARFPRRTARTAAAVPIGPSPAVAGRAGPWQAVLASEATAGGVVRVRCEIPPRAGRVLRRVALRIEAGRGAVPALWARGTKTLALPAGVVEEPGIVDVGRRRQPLTAQFLAVVSGRRSAILAAAGDLAEDLATVRLEGVCIDAGFDPGRVLRKAEHYCVAVATGPDPLVLLDRYGDAMRSRGRHRLGSVCGWNSWDYYGAAVTMADVEAEMRAINAAPWRKHLTHVCVDMGWWTDWGDPTPNRRFPSTLGQVARRIAAAGFVPGIWHAPLQASPWSWLGRHRQDLFVQAPGGGAVQVDGQGILDWSQPEVLEGLHELYRSFRRAGFRYFKLDYIYSQAVARMLHRHDDSIGLAQVIRNGLRAIRDAVGEDSYILNCGAAQEAALGLADGARVCTDIHAFWSHVWHDAREVACRLWESGTLWNVDPDFALVRSHTTSDDRFPQYMHQRRPWRRGEGFWMAGPEATLDELQVWLTVVRMAGGDLFLSDSIARLNRSGVDTLGRLFPRRHGAACPVDLFVSPAPRFWLARDDRRTELAVFNWEDKPSPIVVPAGIDLPTAGTDAWTGARVRVAEETVMAPRSALLLAV